MHINFIFFFTCFVISILIFQCILSFVQFTFKNERQFFLYGVYLFILSINFIVNFYFWLPANSNNQHLIFLKLFFGLPVNYFIYLSYLLFIKAFLQLPQLSKDLNKKINVIIVINIVLGIGTAIGYYNIPIWDFWWQHANMLFTFLLFIYPFYILRKTKVRYYQFIIRGSLCLIIGILLNIIFSLLQFDLTYCDSLLMAGTFIEVLFFNYALQFKMKEQEQQLLLAEIVKQKAITDEYNRVAADLHDEVGSTLSSIHINSVVAQKKINSDVIESKKLLQLIISQSKKMQHNLSDIVWGLRTDLDNIDDFGIKLREIMEHSLGASGIAYSINFEADIADIKLTVLQRRNIMLICKEAINNSLKYAEASTINIEFAKKENGLVIQISDDGIGFNMLATQNITNGLTNMEKRTKQLHGFFKIDTQVNMGTIIICQFPIHLSSNNF
jgi:signal transduction histidine kinase